MDKKSYCIAWLMLLFVGSLHAQYRTTTYCNPLNLDYTYLYTFFFFRRWDGVGGLSCKDCSGTAIFSLLLFL